ncbi:pyridine nucleotide-disulfide oxidoreductase/dicluster-binding protein [uncultured Desulfobulbus sp.]|uniref:pyridine nucleotide-disulfide oxidoreductase/dicluster-binding protein n=1 Tax=uncultured Desulfobulbus sp. TaxID=239745 RepID=UPI0029C6EA69|nr:pyridine nucleotide-disulfide oxidoreductase/dicluster-binding protein [uncultured Desulfobulbus sp.]
MDQPQLRELEARCIQEELPFCTAACPIHVDVRAFMGNMAKGDLREARRILDRTMPFPDIIGRLCDQPCRPFCKRGEIGDPLAVGRLEQFCVVNTQTVLKLPRLPAKGGKVVVIGAGLSGMTAALDLARKGRPTTLITSSSSLGGSLRNYPETALPQSALSQSVALLEGYGVTLQTSAHLDQAAIDTLITTHDAAYFDWDEIDASLLPFGSSKLDPLTLALDREGCFGGGGTHHGQVYSVIKQVDDGRRVALSIERFLQKVSLTAQRDKEGSCATRMVTVTKHYAPAAEILPADPASGYTATEAQAEASRCIQCECMECVKQCVYLREYKEYPKTLIRKIYNNQAIVQGTRNANKMINACSLCGQCTVICPNDFPVAEVVRTTRENMVDNQHMPPSPHDFALEDMHFSLGELCSLSRHQPGTASSRFLFYPGCQLAGSAPEAVKRTYGFLVDQLQGGVGLMLGCCGIQAHWAGQKELFQQIVQDFKMEIKRLGNPMVITACSSCLSIFKEFAGELETTSLWEVLDGLELPASSQNKQQHATPLTLHDPCTARHQQGMQTSIRSLCTKLGLNVVEHAFNGELADCCGYGGLMQMANQPLGRKAAVVKAERSTHDGLAYCAMCRDNLAATGKPVAHLLDYLFPAAEGGSPLTRPNPGFSQRHENRARLKRDLLTTLWPEATDQVSEYKKIRLILNQEVLDLLNSRRVLEDDLQKVIHQAEVSGKYLINPDNKHRLAAFKPVRVTYWVEYEPTDQGFLIHTGYSHRMQLPQDHQ